MPHLSLGHSLVRQWSLRSSGPSNILGTSGIIPFQVLCPPPLRLDETSLRVILCLPDQVLQWFPVRQHWRTPRIQGRRGEAENDICPSFLSNFFILLYFLVLTEPFISLPSWIFPFPTVWHEFSLLTSKVETKLTTQNSRDYLGAPGTVENTVFQSSAFSETLSPPPGIVNALKSGYWVHFQR